MHELALFAGGGGGLLGSKLLGWRTVCYVENDSYAIEVIKARIRDGILDDAPIWDDARTFDGHPWAGYVDIVTAGFPCQPFSLAGKRLGRKDRRNLWPDTLRIIREVRPGYALLENVPALLSSGYFGTILGELAESGYDVRWDCIPASALGAPHQRDRLWIMAHTKGKRKRRLPIRSRRSHKAKADLTRIGEEIPNPDLQHDDISGYGRRPDIGKEKKIDTNPVSFQLEESGNEPAFKGLAEIRWWDTEPELDRVAHGISHRVDRLRTIGNGQVPAVVRAAWILLSKEFQSR